MTDVEYLHLSWQQAITQIDESADLVICDPVYGAKDLSFVAAAAAALKPGGSVYVFEDASGVAQTKVVMDAHPDLKFQNWLIWGPNDWGGRSRTRFGQKHDDLLFYTRRGAAHTFNARDVSVPKATAGASAFNPSGRDWKIPHSVWDDLGGFHTGAAERVRVNGRAVRWQKPEAVIERIVLASSNPGDLVLDFFGGVATVPAVCARLGRRCVSCEVDETVHAAGAARLRSVLDQLT
jgi:DNA modification methylase